MLCYAGDTRNSPGVKKLTSCGKRLTYKQNTIKHCVVEVSARLKCGRGGTAGNLQTDILLDRRLCGF